jgi:hypothetical protein
LTFDRATVERLDKMKDLIAHAHPNASYVKVIAELAKLGLKKWDPAAEKKGRNPKVKRVDAAEKSDEVIASDKTAKLGEITIRCRSHNLLAAVQVFGPDKMQTYLPIRA